MGQLNDQDELSRLGVLAATMGARAGAYHVGFVVEDLGNAIETMTQVLGVPFTEPIDLPFATLQTPDGPREDVKLQFAYSTRPVHVELIGTAPGSLWDFDDRR
ncbi:MAG TPA: VOC family protein, partial [Acidimicrobiales bacterium]|nr:VOC family protein [Acidimicrobiales bacterium]